jgi:phytoene dehydrogenase-like protein
MPAKNFYDAVLVGINLYTLLTGALLAKRGFRVLVVGQHQPLPSYKVEGLALPRGTSALLAADSPAVTRVISELALKPLLRRRMRPLSPAFQAILPEHRIDLDASPELVAHEVEREFPAVRRAADDFVRASQRCWENLNRLIERDLVWPPGGFFERREFARAALQQPFGKDDAGTPLAELADDHPLRAIINAALRFSDGTSLGSGNPQRELRQISALLHAVELAEGGMLGLWELLIESIRTHNGEVRLADRVDGITVRRASIDAVRLSPSDEEIGCHFVLSGLSVSRLARLLSDRRNLDQLLDEQGAPAPWAFRYTLNVVVAAEAIPEGLARNAFLLASSRAQLGEDVLRIEHTGLTSELAVLSAQALIPVASLEGDSGYLEGMRERVLGRLTELSPFLHGHIRLVDSPHDGRGVFHAASGQTRPTSDGQRRGPETMPTLYAFPRKELHGCTALPIRTPIKRLLLCSDQVVPGLSNEGAFLTAWSVARIVARSLGRQWMNRGRWTKVEL